MKKQTMKESDFYSVAEEAKKVSQERIDKITEEAVTKIQDNTSQDTYLAFSGGKESIVLQDLALKAGQPQSFIVLTHDSLEYPQFIDWLDHSKYSNVYRQIRTKLDLKWLKNNIDMLFPNHHLTVNKWGTIVQRAGQDIFLREHKAKTLLLGRRKDDGNYPGKDGKGGYVKAGVERICPIWDWSMVELFAYIQHAKLELPPIYNYPRGYETGSGPWAKRKRLDTSEATWEEIISQDKRLQQAKEYLET